MRKPSKGSQKTDEADDQAPPGGSALGRIRQDRLARGLRGITRSATLSLEDSKPPEPSRTPRAQGEAGWRRGIMRGPIDDRGDQRTLRRRSSAAAKQRYPAGRALGRIEYFETQRALARTVFAEGRVLSSAAAAPRVSNRALRSPRAGQASLSAYATANKQKARLTPGVDQSGQLPVWRPLGSSSIPRGQTYGSGGNNTPAVSGRCVGIVVSPTNPSTSCSARPAAASGARSISGGRGSR